jgi:GNAT superfamily N-acetyltransferase
MVAPEIRLLNESDSLTELTALLHRAYAQLGKRGLNYTAVDQSEQVTAQRIQEGICFVATITDRLIGTLVLTKPNLQSVCAYFRRPQTPSIHQFAVDPSQQGSGLGKAILQTAEAWAQSQGFSELALDTAEPATHLIARYRKWGYEIVDHVQWPGKSYLSVVMSKQLPLALKIENKIDAD